MRALGGVLLLGMAVGSTGCYHATVETGAPPSAETVSKAWAAGWIYGLVPPSTVETAQKCTSGVARVETQLSFANQLVSLLTLGIFTPMEIKVTCAASRTAESGEGAVIRVGEDEPTLEAAVARALELSRQLGQAVDIVF